MLFLIQVGDKLSIKFSYHKFRLRFGKGVKLLGSIDGNMIDYVNLLANFPSAYRWLSNFLSSKNDLDTFRVIKEVIEYNNIPYNRLFIKYFFACDSLRGNMGKEFNNIIYSHVYNWFKMGILSEDVIEKYNTNPIINNETKKKAYWIVRKNLIKWGLL